MRRRDERSRMLHVALNGRSAVSISARRTSAPAGASFESNITRAKNRPLPVSSNCCASVILQFARNNVLENAATIPGRFTHARVSTNDLLGISLNTTSEHHDQLWVDTLQGQTESFIGSALIDWGQAFRKPFFHGTPICFAGFVHDAQ